MKRKRIEIITIIFIALCSVLLYIIESNKISWFYKSWGISGIIRGVLFWDSLYMC